MPLQNRVDPFGAIHAVAERGMFTGNRGIIHDPSTRTLLARRWALKAWIICLCEFRGRRREPMGRNGPGGRAGWTELFFLDEPTALAAGHRPCFFCQREHAKGFAGAFGDAFDIASPKAPEIDRRLHTERFASSKKPLPKLDAKEISSLPDGAMVARGEHAYAIRGGNLLPWSFGGYRPAAAGPGTGGDFTLITPRTTVAVLKAGYRARWHPSAG